MINKKWIYHEPIDPETSTREYALNAQWTIINRINGFSILGITEINGNNNINALFTLNKSTNDSFYISESTIRCLERFNNSVFKAYCYIESCRIIYFDRYILRLIYYIYPSQLLQYYCPEIKAAIELLLPEIKSEWLGLIPPLY